MDLLQEKTTENKANKQELAKPKRVGKAEPPARAKKKNKRKGKYLGGSYLNNSRGDNSPTSKHPIIFEQTLTPNSQISTMPLDI